MNRRMAAVILLFFSFFLVARAADDPHVGIWKLNLEKSKFNPGPLPRSRTVTIVPFGDGVKLRTEEITAEGKQRTVEYSATYDGKEHPRTESGAGAVSG